MAMFLNGNWNCYPFVCSLLWTSSEKWNQENFCLVLLEIMMDFFVTFTFLSWKGCLRHHYNKSILSKRISKQNTKMFGGIITYLISFVFLRVPNDFKSIGERNKVCNFNEPVLMRIKINTPHLWLYFPKYELQWVFRLYKPRSVECSMFVMRLSLIRSAPLRKPQESITKTLKSHVTSYNRPRFFRFPLPFVCGYCLYTVTTWQ